MQKLDRNRTRFSFVLLGSICLVFALASFAGNPSVSAQSDPPPDLFDPFAPPGDIILPPNDYVIHQKSVYVIEDVLSQESFSIALFNGDSITAQRRSTQRSGANILWRGVLEGLPGSSVTLILKDGDVTGAIYMNGASYVLAPHDGSTHLFRQIAQLEFDEHNDSVDVAVETDERVVAAGLESILTPAGDPIIDVMILWTPKSRTELMANGGGTIGSIPGASTNPGTIFTDMEEWVNFTIQIANEAYFNSMSDVRLRLVHAQEINYSELDGNGIQKPYSSKTADPRPGYLDELRDGGNGTGPLAAVQSLESLYKADFVALLVDVDPALVLQPDNARTANQAGVASRPRSNPEFTLSANKSVTRWDTVFPNFTFTHELGHNMGLHHDQDNAGSSTTFVPYSFGYQDPSFQYRTILSTFCPSLPASAPFCQRINYLSNPSKNFPAPSASEAMGQPDGSAEPADNARAIDDSSGFIAAYRNEVYDIAIGDTLRMNGIVFGEWGDGTANEACASDQDNADDVGGVDDATRHCVATNQVDQFYFLQSIDDTSITAGDPTTVCTLVDTDPDQFINYAVCTTVKDDGTTNSPNSEVDKVELYSCNNTTKDTCAGAALVKTYNAARPLAGGHYSDGVYHFGNDENGPFGNTDSQLEIQVPYTDMGVSNGDNVCTKLVTFGDTGSLATALDSVLQAANYIEYDTNDGVGSVGQCTTTLAIDKSASATSVAVNGSVDYTIRVTNTGKVAADAVLTDIFPTNVTVGACTASMTEYSYSATETALGTFPIEQASCTDASGVTGVVEFMANPFPGNPVTSPLTCVFDVPNQAKVSSVDLRATVTARANATFEMNEVKVISPAGTESLKSTGNSGFDLGQPNWDLPEVYASTGDPTFANENASGQWQFQFFDRGFNDPSVELRIVPSAGNTEVTIHGYQQVATVTNPTTGDLATGASHRIKPGDVLEYVCPVTIPETICPDSDNLTAIDNTATVAAMQDSIASRDDSASFNVTTGDTCPTPVQLVSFMVEPNGDTTTLMWETAAEINSAGFNLYRSPKMDGLLRSYPEAREWTRVNDDLIPAEGSPLTGASYTFIDSTFNNSTFNNSNSSAGFDYQLETVDVNGNSAKYAPSLSAPAAERQSTETWQYFLPLLRK